MTHKMRAMIIFCKNCREEIQFSVSQRWEGGDITASIYPHYKYKRKPPKEVFFE